MPTYKKAVFCDMPLKFDGKEVVVSITATLTFSVESSYDSIDVSKTALNQLLEGKELKNIKFGAMELLD